METVLGSPGQALDATTRAVMEPRFGQDFSAVRVHTDTQAALSAAAVGAQAYTVGRHVVMGSGQYQPTSQVGRRLLAHELAHIIQQRESTHGLSEGLSVGDPDTPAEHEADRAAGSVVASTMAPALTDTAGRQVDSRPATGRMHPVAQVIRNTLSRQPQPPGLAMPRVQTTRADFHDPNFCYRMTLRDATHPDRTKVVAVMQAQILTPSSCDDPLILRTSVLESDWGASVAQFESFGGGASQGLDEGIWRDDSAERVDYEERFTLDNCQADFDRCHLITHSEGGRKYIFAEAAFQPRLFPTSEPSGTVLHDSTPSPSLRVEPCDNITPSRCGAPAPAPAKKPAPAKQPAPRPGSKAKR